MREKNQTPVGNHFLRRKRIFGIKKKSNASWQPFLAPRKFSRHQEKIKRQLAIFS
jgi:hypothetical protein